MRTSATRWQRCKAQLINEAIGVLTAANVQAARSLRKLLHSRDEMVRLRACRVVLESGMRLRQVGEFEQRLAEFESRIAFVQSGRLNLRGGDVNPKWIAYLISCNGRLTRR